MCIGLGGVTPEADAMGLAPSASPPITASAAAADEIEIRRVLLID
jgi:hypothetical protein